MVHGPAADKWTMVSGGSEFAADVFQIEMDSGASAGDYAHGYQVYVSNDGTNWGSPLVSAAGSSQGVSVTLANQTARYIRVMQTGSATQWWSLHEFNVLATAATLPQSAGPILLTEADTNRAIALDSVLFLLLKTVALECSGDHEMELTPSCKLYYLCRCYP